MWHIHRCDVPKRKPPFSWDFLSPRNFSISFVHPVAVPMAQRRKATSTCITVRNLNLVSVVKHRTILRCFRNIWMASRKHLSWQCWLWVSFWERPRTWAGLLLVMHICQCTPMTWRNTQASLRIYQDYQLYVWLIQLPRLTCSPVSAHLIETANIRSLLGMRWSIWKILQVSFEMLVRTHKLSLSPASSDSGSGNEIVYHMLDCICSTQLFWSLPRALSLSLSLVFSFPLSVATKKKKSTKITFTTDLMCSLF